MNYLERAKRFGQNIEALQSGKVLNDIIKINSVEHFRELFAGSLAGGQRSAFTKSLPSDMGAVGEPAARLANYVYGSGELSPDDRSYADALFPVEVEVMSAENIIISTDIVVGPSGRPYSINAGRLIFLRGSITAISTALTIQAEMLEVRSGGSKPYHIGILGAKGPTGDHGPDGPPYNGRAQDGSDSSPRSPGVCTGAPSGGNGTNGSAGNIGGVGFNGGNGVASQPATVNIKAFDPSSDSQLVIFTQSGTGGDGGHGGHGGTGQGGGNGGKGCDSGCEGTDGGNGGNAGTGGKGGDGGNGGNGTSGLAIAVFFPGAHRDKLQTSSSVAPVGQSGEGGAGGQAGQAGRGGRGGKHHADGKAGSGASDGAAGAAGSPGTVTGIPAAINPVWT